MEEEVSQNDRSRMSNSGTMNNKQTASRKHVRKNAERPELENFKD